MISLVLVTALFTVYTVIRTPSFQKFAGRVVASYLSDKLGAKVLLESFRVSDWLRVDMRNLSIEDLKENTMLSAGHLEIGATRLSLKERKLSFRDIILEDGSFFLVTYAGDSVLNLIRLLDPLISGTELDTVPTVWWDIDCNNIIINGMSFNLRNENRMMPSEGMDYNDMAVSSISLLAENFRMSGDSLSAVILLLKAKEKSGLNLKRFTGLASYTPRGAKVSGLEIEVNASVIDLDLAFTYYHPRAFLDFIHEVTITSTIRESSLKMRDIGYFAPVMFAMDNDIRFSGDFRGTVADFEAGGFAFHLGSLTQFEGDIRMAGLPDIYTTEAMLDVRKFNVLPADISQFALPGSTTYVQLPELLEKLGLIKIQGTFSGLYNDFDLKSGIKTELGNLDLDFRFGQMADRQVPFYVGDIKGKGLALGELLEYPDLGTFDVEAEIQGSGITESDLNAFANIWIENLLFKDHHYDRIVLGGDFTVNTFFGRCLVFDEALQLAFNGLVDFSKELPEFNFYADLEKARFYDMNLSDRAPDMELKGKFEGDFAGIDPDTFLGNIVLDSLVYIEDRKTYILQHLDLQRQRDKVLGDLITIRSDYVDADARGKFSAKFLAPQLISLFTEAKDDYFSDTTIWDHPQDITFDLHFKNTDDITDLFLKSLRLAPNTLISGNFDSRSRNLDIYGNIDFISYLDFQARNISFNTNTTSSGLNFQSEMASLSLLMSSGSDRTDLVAIENLFISSEMKEDSISFLITWDDEIPEDLNKGLLGGFFLLPRDGRIEGSITDAEAQVNGEQWLIDPENYLVFDTNYIEFTNLVIAGYQERFFIDGRLSKQVNDTLDVRFDNWSIANFNPILTQFSLNMDGRVNGTISLNYLEGAPNLFSSLTIDSLELHRTLLGRTRINTNWIADDKALLVNLQVLPPGSAENYKVLHVNGLVYPMDPSRNFDLDVVSQNLQLSFLSPFLSSFSSAFSGLASGQLHLGGTFRDLELTGKLKLQRTELKIDYLNVTYTLSNEISFTKDAISFQDVLIYDEMTNQATCSGALTHNHFRDMRLDLTIHPQDLLAMNLGRYENDVFYGTAYVSGKVRIYGPFDDLTIATDVTTSKGTNVFIPINYSVDVSQSDFILFRDQFDSTSLLEDYRVVIEGFKLDMGIGVRPEANVQIFLPSDMGSIKASGQGDLRLGVDPRGYLTLHGKYTIITGLFVFSLEQLVSKRFEIAPGSNITWYGDLNNAEVKIAASFRTKTSLAGLGIAMLDPTSADRKVNVVVRIYMTENLFNPNLRFTILFPNLDEQTRQAIYTVLDTTDVALMNQQAISLMILNSFTYAGASGSNPINSTAILANSLSNMLSSVSNDFDIGFNYIPGDAASSEEVEVALSTQLFDDRLIIDGNFGVSSENNTQKTSSIVGDVQVEYKLTSDGRFRVKAFNRSNDISIIDNDVPYTQGIGIFYRKEFDNLKELFTAPGGKRDRKKN